MSKADYSDQLIDRVAQLENTLEWIGHLARTHYLGGAFDPEHMRAIANLTVDGLTGKELPNFQDSMKAALEHGKKQWEELQYLIDDGGLVNRD